MKILLINPPKLSQEIYGIYSIGAPDLPPLGLCYLAGILLEDGHEVKIVDAAGEVLSFAEVGKRIMEYSPKIVGLTSMTISYKSACKIIDMAEEINNSIVTILGGAHVSGSPYEVMKECENLDIAVIGEGERTIKEVVRSMEDNKNMNSIKGIYYRKYGDVVENPPRELERNIDLFPMPNRDLLKDLRLYSHLATRGSQKLTTTMITSRGCPFHCGFCEQSVFGRTWRGHSPDYVIGEIKILMDKHKVKFISIEDDNFNFDRNRVVEICQKMMGDKIRVEWGCSVKADSLDEELLKIMKEAGCKNIYIGIESGSCRMLSLFQKKVKKEVYIDIINLIKKIGLRVHGSFILGAPTESIDEIKKTIGFAISLPLDGVSFFLFTPYPNTRLRSLAFKNGTVSKNWDDYTGHPKSPPYINNGFTEKEILNIQKWAYVKFYFRFGYVVNHPQLIIDLIFKTAKFVFRSIFGTNKKSAT